MIENNHSENNENNSVHNGGVASDSRNEMADVRRNIIPGMGKTDSRQNSESPKDIPQRTQSPHNCLGKIKYWLQVQCELPKEIFNFTVDIINNILSMDQLLDFMIKCNVPNYWVERAKQDYPHNSEMMVMKVFCEWWGRSNLNVGKKIQMIHIVYVYMGKPAVFNRIIGKYADLEILFEYARSNIAPALTGEDRVV